MDLTTYIENRIYKEGDNSTIRKFWNYLRGINKIFTYQDAKNLLLYAPSGETISPDNFRFKNAMRMAKELGFDATKADYQSNRRALVAAKISEEEFNELIAEFLG